MGGRLIISEGVGAFFGGRGAAGNLEGEGGWKGKGEGERGAAFRGEEISIGKAHARRPVFTQISKAIFANASKTLSFFLSEPKL